MKQSWALTVPLRLQHISAHNAVAAHSTQSSIPAPCCAPGAAAALWMPPWPAPGPPGSAIVSNLARAMYPQGWKHRTAANKRVRMDLRVHLCMYCLHASSALYIASGSPPRRHSMPTHAGLAWPGSLRVVQGRPFSFSPYRPSHIAGRQADISFVDGSCSDIALFQSIHPPNR